MADICVCVAVISISGCGDSGISDGLTDEQFGIDFADRAVALWLGTDYTAGGDGSSGIDGAGTVFVTLQDMNYDIPDAVADGIHDNYDNTLPTPVSFDYTLITAVATEAQLQNGDFSTLRKGDLIFLDYDFDNEWDHVAIYLGVYGSFVHAALTASDYYDEYVIADLDDYNDPLAQDIAWSQGPWHLSGTMAAQSGMTDKWLSEQGLISVKEQCVKIHYPATAR